MIYIRHPHRSPKYYSGARLPGYPAAAGMYVRIYRYVCACMHKAHGNTRAAC